jgi:hypothetical protein
MNITGNGDFHLKPKVRGKGAGTSIIYVSGTFGTATVTLNYKDETGTFIPLTDGVLAVDTQNSVDHGVGMDVYAVIATADGTTDINIELANKV